MSVSRLVAVVFITQLIIVASFCVFQEKVYLMPLWSRLLFYVLVFGVGYLFVIKKIISVLNHISGLGKDTKKISGVVSELALESQYLLDSANAQSRSIQTSASSIEEMSAMAEQTATQASESSEIVTEIDKASKDGSIIMQELNDSIGSINKVRADIEKIQEIFQKVTEKTIVIDEIVFNTRLLSFNASIEAERAGSMGAGFAVVAQEIGKLANHSGDAAREIREILKHSGEQVGAIVVETSDKVTKGIEVTERATVSFQQIAESISEVSKRIDNISAATREQNIGIKQIAEAVSMMDRSAQENVRVARSTETFSTQTEESINDLFNSLKGMSLSVSKLSGAKLALTMSSSKEFMPWDDSYSVGLNTIDDQHRVLVDLINKLYRAIRQGSDESRLKTVFDELINYTDKHFSFEESWFAKTRYQGTDEHVKLHRELVKTIVMMKEKFFAGQSVTARQLMDFLKNWLLNHIGREDPKYVSTFKKHGMN